MYGGDDERDDVLAVVAGCRGRLSCGPQRYRPRCRLGGGNALEPRLDPGEVVILEVVRETTKGMKFRPLC